MDIILLPTGTKVFVAKHTIFLQKELLDAVASGRIIKLNKIRGKPQTNLPLMEPEQDATQDVVSTPEPSIQGLHRLTRVHLDLEKYGFLIMTHGDVLYTYEDAMSDIDFEKWLNAMKFEMDSMYTNQV